METDKGFFIENILKDSKTEKSEKYLEKENSTDHVAEAEEVNSADPEESHWLNPGSSSASQILGILPTVYPVISNRLDTHEGKRN